MTDRILCHPQLEKINRLLSNNSLDVQVNDVYIKVFWLNYHLTTTLHTQKVHRHSFCELHLCLRGTCRYLIGDRICDIHPGEALFIGADVLHRCESISPDFSKAALGFVVATQGNKLSDRLRGIFQANGVMILRETDAIMEHFYRILEELSCQKTGAMSAVGMRVFAVVLELARQGDTMSVQRNSDLHRIDSRIDELNAFIENHIQEKITCDMAASSMHMSHRQLNRIIHEAYGYSLGAHIAKRKCECARERLLNTTDSISEIAAAVGFADEFSFSKFFKRTEGMPPGIFRRSHFTAMHPAYAPERKGPDVQFRHKGG